MTTATLVEPQSGFHALSLSPSVLAALSRATYLEPTPIQAALIPAALSGRDVLGQAQTGTGKTAAFLLPFLDRWRDRNEPGPQALVLAPTRELVVQVSEEARKISPSKHLRSVPIYGGQRFRRQLDELNAATWKASAAVVGQWGREPPAEDTALELCARYAFAILLDLSRAAVERRLPMKMDY